MKSEIKSSDGLVREIEIEVDSDTVAAAFAEAYKKYQKDAKIKGFRPGKAPMNIIKSRYGDSVRADVFDSLVQDSYPQAIREQNLDVASQPELVDVKLEEGSPLKYIARVEIMPEIENINYDDLKLPQDDTEVRDSEVNTVVDFLRKKHADVRPVSRPAEKNDIVLVDLAKIDDPDNVLEQNDFSDTEVDLDSHVTLAEFKEALPGMKAGDEKEIEVSYSDRHGNQALAGKKIKYLCKVKEVRERVLPEVNDAFAKKLGETETALELRLKIREDLKKQKEIDREKWRHDEVQRQFLENNQIDVPANMVEKYLDRMYEETKKKGQQIDEKTFRDSYRPIAVNGIRWMLLTEKISKDEKIEVSVEDTEKWIKSFADNYNMTLEQAKEALGRSGQIQEIRDSIMDHKILDFLMTRVTYVPVAEEEKEHTEEK